MVKKFVYAVNSIPFAGKLTIRPIAFSYWNATTKGRKFSAFVGLALVLLLFILAHGSQALLCFQAMSLSKHIFLNIVFISHGLANIAGVVAQCHLLFRATKHLPKSLPKTARIYVGMGCGSTIVHVLVTLLGQTTFMVAYSISQSH